MLPRLTRVPSGIGSLLLRSLRPVMTPGRIGPTTMALAPSARSALLSYSASAFQQQASNTAQLKVDNPELMIAFTCKKCDTRSSHTMSKQAYTSGTVLIKCPGCNNRHLIADHLKIFSDDSITIEDILAAKGESASSNLDDLVFEDIPEKLKGLLGRHAKDAPEEFKEKVDEDGDFKKIPGPKE